MKIPFFRINGGGAERNRGNDVDDVLTQVPESIRFSGIEEVKAAEIVSENDTDPLAKRWTVVVYEEKKPKDYRQLGPITREIVGLLPERFRTERLNRTIGSFKTREEADFRRVLEEGNETHNLINTMGRKRSLKVEPEVLV